MRKWNMMLPALLLACCAAAPAAAQDGSMPLPALFSAAGEGLRAGIETAALEMQRLDGDLTLSLEPQDARLEEGKTLRLTVRAGNPLPREAAVRLELKLPQRLAAAPDSAWQAVLPAAQVDPRTGALTPSETVFTREIALAPDGESEMAEIGCEMSMGTRFYRAGTSVQLCVPDVAVTGHTEGTKDGRLNPGDAFAYRIRLTNGGAAPKDVRLSLQLPEGVMLTGAPQGFSSEDGVISGMVAARAAQEGAPFETELRFEAAVSGDALAGDEDAMRLMSGVLTVDGERTPLPRVQVCGPMISAKLVADAQELAIGEETTLRIVLANAGQAEASVRVSCLLPQGLEIVSQDEAARKETAGEPQTKVGKTEADSSEEADDDAPDAVSGAAASGGPGAGAAIPAEANTAAPGDEQGALVFDVAMQAADGTQGGVTAGTRVIPVQVRALEPQEDLRERLLGASLSWSVDGGETQLGHAVAMRVYRPQILGIPKEEWSGILWASGLLLITVCCLYAAAHKGAKEEDVCLE